MNKYAAGCHGSAPNKSQSVDFCMNASSGERLQKLRSWWKGLTRVRKIGFALGLGGYFGSYEYIHDFGIKRPKMAFLSVLLMIVSGHAEGRPKSNCLSRAEDSSPVPGSDGNATEIPTDSDESRLS